MAKAKRAPAKKKPAAKGPTADRPYMPGYGVPKDQKGLLPWSQVTKRMTSAMRYWVSTVSEDGHPHATPVDGLWIDERLFFGGDPRTRRHRNLAANPAVCVHLEDPLDVVIFYGEAHELEAPDRALAVRLSGQSKSKYGFAPPPEQYSKGGVFVFRPQKAIAWKKFPKDATRWRF